MPLLSQGLRPGVDQFPGDFLVLGPGWEEPPADQVQGGVVRLGMRPRNQVVVAWCTVVVWRSVGEPSRQVLGPIDFLAWSRTRRVPDTKPRARTFGCSISGYQRLLNYNSSQIDPSSGCGAFPLRARRRLLVTILDPITGETVVIDTEPPRRQ